MRNIGVLFFMLLLSSCGAQMVTTRGFSKSEFAPTNETSMKGGSIKYLAQGADFVIRARREDSYKQMFETCNGPYEITSESTKSYGGSAITIGGGNSVYESDSWVHIDFVCEN